MRGPARRAFSSENDGTPGMTMDDATQPVDTRDGLQESIGAIVARQAAFAAAGMPRDVAFRRHKLRLLKSVLKAGEKRLFDAMAADMAKSFFGACLTEFGLIPPRSTRRSAGSQPGTAPSGVLST